MLAQNANDLLLREPCLLHRSVLVKAGLSLHAEENRCGGSAVLQLAANSGNLSPTEASIRRISVE